MAQPTIQASFNSGEWAPQLFSRVDVEKYKSGAALLKDFYVDYRGGASTRVGTKYIIRGYKDNAAIRLIPFQASFDVAYVLEFGDLYVRFHREGAPVLESGLTITGATKANPCVLTVANTYTTGSVDWIYVSGVGGMTQLNGKYFKVSSRTAGTVTLADLFGNPVDSTGYSTYTTGGTTQRIYTLTSPYAATDLSLLKFVQNIENLIICHPNYAVRELTYTSAASWAFTSISFAPSLSAPVMNALSTTLSAGAVSYAYTVTAVDGDGQESPAATPKALTPYQDLRTTAGSIVVSWTAVTGAIGYNVYKADPTYGAVVPPGAPYGFIGFSSGGVLIDSNIIADFSNPPPTTNNPFNVGQGVSTVTITNAGSYTTACTVTFGAAPSGGLTATGTVVFGANTISSIAAGGAGYNIGDTIVLDSYGAVLTVTNVAAGAVTAASVTSPGSGVGPLPTNPVAQLATSGAGTGATFNMTWKVISITLTNGGGFGYSSPPGVNFSAGAATGTAVLGAANAGFPSVPAFFQQRLVLANTVTQPQTMHLSQPGYFYNYNISIPSQDDDAITATIVNGQLNNIKAMLPTPGGLIVLTDGASFLVNGGSLGSAVTPTTVTANAQSFLGCNDMPPIVVNYDILYVQSKGSAVRDSSYNFYANVFTGEDVSIISSHLFFGYELLEWCWAEEPYRLVWAVRNDGAMLAFTFLKEQDFKAWTHHHTDGNFKSVATIVEEASVGYQNYVYLVVERSINSNTVKYIEYMPERSISGLVEDAWTVDCGVGYVGSPATSFSGGEFLVGKTCTGLADGEIIPPFTMAASGNFTLAQAASKVTVGLAFTPQLQTLPIDLGEPMIQSKAKKIPAVDVRVVDTLGLRIGPNFNELVDMSDLVRGEVSTTRRGLEDQIVTDLVSGDAHQTLAPTYNIYGQYCIEQSYPYPATITGVFPELEVGDTAK